MADEISDKRLKARQDQRNKDVARRLRQLERERATTERATTARSAKAERHSATAALTKLRVQEKQVSKDLSKTVLNVVRRTQLESSLQSMRAEIERLSLLTARKKPKESFSLPLLALEPATDPANISNDGSAVAKTLSKKRRFKRNSKQNDAPASTPDMDFWSNLSTNPDFQLFFAPATESDMAPTSAFVKSPSGNIVAVDPNPLAFTTSIPTDANTDGASTEIVRELNELRRRAEIAAVDRLAAETDLVAARRQLDVERKRVILERDNATAAGVRADDTDKRLLELEQLQAHMEIQAAVIESQRTKSRRERLVAKVTGKQIDTPPSQSPLLALPSGAPSEPPPDIRDAFRKARQDRADMRAAKQTASEMDQHVAQRDADTVTSLSDRAVKKQQREESDAIVKTLAIEQRDVWIHAKVDGTPTTPLRPIVDPERQSVRSRIKYAQTATNIDPATITPRKATKEERAVALAEHKQAAVIEKTRRAQERTDNKARRAAAREQGQSLRERITESRIARQSNRRLRAEFRHAGKVRVNELRAAKRNTRAFTKKNRHVAKPVENVAPVQSRRSKRLEKQMVRTTQKNATPSSSPGGVHKKLTRRQTRADAKEQKRIASEHSRLDLHTKDTRKQVRAIKRLEKESAKLERRQRSRRSGTLKADAKTQKSSQRSRKLAKVHKKVDSKSSATRERLQQRESVKINRRVSRAERALARAAAHSSMPSSATIDSRYSLNAKAKLLGGATVSHDIDPAMFDIPEGLPTRSR